MGMSMGKGNAINVTPLIDVLLVLLIIFLVMIPIMARIEPIALPPKAPPDSITEDVPVVIKLHGDLTISIDDGPAVQSAELSSIRTRAIKVKQVFVDADATLPWTEVVSIVDRVRGLGDNVDAIQVAVRIHDLETP